MQIVIDIPEDMYKRIKEKEYEIKKRKILTLEKAVLEGKIIKK